MAISPSYSSVPYPNTGINGSFPNHGSFIQPTQKCATCRCSLEPMDVDVHMRWHLTTGTEADDEPEDLVVLSRTALLEFFGEMALTPFAADDDCAPKAARILEWLRTNER